MRMSVKTTNIDCLNTPVKPSSSNSLWKERRTILKKALEGTVSLSMCGCAVVEDPGLAAPFPGAKKPGGWMFESVARSMSLPGSANGLTQQKTKYRTLGSCQPVICK